MSERRERYRAAIRENDGWVLDDGQHVIDAVMAVADAELDEAGATIANQTAEIRRLGEMVDQYGRGASALTFKLKQARGVHRETCPIAKGELSPPAFTCSMCDLLDTPATELRRTADDTQHPNVPEPKDPHA